MGTGEPGAALWGALRGLLTDVSGDDPKGLNHQSLLPSGRNAVQNPALGRELERRSSVLMLLRVLGINKGITQLYRKTGTFKTKDNECF